jgi:hypothetical protein
MPVDLPFSLPDWMPAWGVLLVGLPLLLWVLAFLLVPFSVIGLKSRIDGLEAQIDALHEDLRIIGMRAAGVLPPAPRTYSGYEEVPEFTQMKRAQQAAPPPPAASTGYAPLTAKREVPPPPRPRRAEPRLD